MSTDKESGHVETPASIKRKIGDAIGIFYLRLYFTAKDLAGLEELQTPATLQLLTSYLAKCSRRGVFDELRAQLMSEAGAKALNMAPFLRYYLNEAIFDRDLEAKKAEHVAKMAKIKLKKQKTR